MKLAAIPDRNWDVAIVGAGPAGAVAALLLARQHRRVLLVDRARFPRDKVCGCCLGARGVKLCRSLGLSTILQSATTLDRLEIRHAEQTLELEIPPGLAMPRGTLDEALAMAATDAGATFIDNCNARLTDDDGQLLLMQDGDQITIRPRLIIAADGIHGRLLDALPDCQWQIARDAWMGAAVTLDVNARKCPPGFICMHLAEQGYVGAVRMADGRVHLAAALCPDACRAASGPAHVMRRILHDAADWDIPQLTGAKLLGSPLLTRTRKEFGHGRILAVGDACTYIEPFTGEGMTWAIESVVLLADFLHASLDDLPQSLASSWTQLHHASFRRRQQVCRSMRWLLHHPRLSHGALRAARMVPAIGRMAVHRLEVAV